MLYGDWRLSYARIAYAAAAECVCTYTIYYRPPRIYSVSVDHLTLLSYRRRYALVIGNDSVPKIIINNAINYFLTAINILIISNNKFPTPV